MEEEIKNIALTQEATNKILKYLQEYGFKILSFGSGFNNPFEEISEEYFNEKVNEALNN